MGRSYTCSEAKRLHANRKSGNGANVAENFGTYMYRTRSSKNTI